MPERFTIIDTKIKFNQSVICMILKSLRNFIYYFFNIELMPVNFFFRITVVF